MVGMFVAMGAELFQFQPCRRVATVFHSSVTRNALGAFIWVGTTLGTFQGHDNANTFSHLSTNSIWAELDTNIYHFISGVALPSDF